MSVLILHRNPFEPFPYRRWLHDYDGQIVVLAARDKLVQFGEDVPDLGPVRLELLDSFADEAVLRRRAMELAAEFGVRHVLAHHEGDVLVAAEVRECFALPGGTVEDVMPFRDKALMKQRLRAAGIETAPYLVPAGVADATAFADEHGLPLVVKDRAGYGSTGLRIFERRAEFDRFVADTLADGRDDLLLESFVPGRMCHVDGLVLDGAVASVWPSQYQYDLASFDADPGARIDLTLDPDDPLTDRLIELTECALAALRPADGGRMPSHGFHGEVFHTPDDRLVVCEFACRTGGAKVREVHEAMFGFNIGECMTRAQTGLPLPQFEDFQRTGERPRPARMAGQVVMMKRPGLVRSLPAIPEEPWVDRFWLYAREGQEIPPAAGSADFLLSAVTSGQDRVETERRSRELGARFEAQTAIGGPR